jgi:hypothetical protein
VATLDALTRVRNICLSFPETTEQEAWGEPTFRVRQKVFAMFAAAGTHHGKGFDSVWCKAALGVQEQLVRSDSAIYFVPPYVGVRGWVGIRIDQLEDFQLRSHILESFCIVAPKRMLRDLEMP